MTGHFQMMLTEIQAQIEQHSVRNDKLCHENTNLTDKLESLMGQCELREEVRSKVITLISGLTDQAINITLLLLLLCRIWRRSTSAATCSKN